MVELSRKARRILLSVLLSGSLEAVSATECEPLTDTVGVAANGLLAYRLDPGKADELVGRDGARVSTVRFSRPKPTLTYSGVAAPQHWANLVDVELYRHRKAESVYRFAQHAGRMRVCRIEAGDDEVERFHYDVAGRMTGWQRFWKNKGEWEISAHRCFGYDAQGRIHTYSQAEKWLDCDRLTPEQIEEHYLHDASGALTRVINWNSRTWEGAREPGAAPGIRVTIFGRDGKATHFIETVGDGDPLMFAVEPSGDGPINAADYNFVKISGPRIHMYTGPEYLYLNWKFVLTKSTVEPGRGSLFKEDFEKVVATGTVEEEGEGGRVRLSEREQREIWSLVRTYPERVYCIVAGTVLPVRLVYPAAGFARCIDPLQPEASACRPYGDAEQPPK